MLGMHRRGDGGIKEKSDVELFLENMLGLFG